MYNLRRLYISKELQHLITIVHCAVPPGEPHHDCPEVVNEQSTISCKCTSLNPGSPPAEIVWDGVFDNSNTLLIQTVEQQSTVNSYTCRLTWGPEGFINRTVVYTFKIVGKYKLYY